MTKMSETRIHPQQNLGLVEEGFICYVLLSGKYKCENFHKIVAASLSGQAAKVELFPFIATRSQLQRSQVIRELHEMLHCWLAGGGRGNHCRTVSTDI